MHALKIKKKKIEKKIAEHHFNPFRVEQKAFTLGKVMGFPACMDQSKAYLSLAVVCITQLEIPREEFGKVGSKYC